MTNNKGHSKISEPGSMISESYVVSLIRQFIKNAKAKDIQLTDEILWEEFREYFEGWTRENFSIVPTTELHVLRQYLREHGVFVAKQTGYSVAEALEKLLTEEQPTEWIQQQITEQMRRRFRSKFNPTTTQRRIDAIVLDENCIAVPRSTVLVTRNTTSPAGQANQTPLMNRARITLQRLLNNQVFPAGEPPNDRYYPPGPIPPWQQYSNYRYINQEVYIYTQQPSKDDQERQKQQSLATLMEIYTNEMKYSGGDDLLDLKLEEFEDMCNIAGVAEEHRALALPIILKGSAKDFYTLTIRGNITGYEAIVAALRGNFETEQRLRINQHAWNSITLKKVIDENANKSISECLKLLITELQRMHRRLPTYNLTGYNADLALRNKLLDACRRVPACQLACMKPGPTFQTFIAELHMSIDISTPPASQQLPSEYSVYTDRRFHGSKKNSAQKSNNNLSDKLRCFVCDKEGCWSSEHTTEERKRSLDTHKRRDRAAGRRLNSSQIRQFIISYEGAKPIEEEDNTSYTPIASEEDDEDVEKFTNYLENGHFFTEF